MRSNLTAMIRITIFSILGLLAPQLALAASTPDIENDLEEFDEELETRGHTHFGRGLLDRGLEGHDRLRNKVNDRHGLDWAVGASYLYQAHDRGSGKKWTNNFELDVYAEWDIVDSETFGKGSLTYLSSHIWEKRNMTGFGSGAGTSDFTNSLGSVFETSDSSNFDARVRQLYWTQSTRDDSFEVHVGQIENAAFIDDNSYANNDRDKFIAAVWTKTTRSTVNVFGLGAAVGITPSENYYLRAAFVDANTNGENPKWSTFEKGEYIYTYELGFTPTIEGWGKGIYRISPWHAQRAETGKQGSGVSVSFEQETPWDMALWLRAGYSDNRRNNFEKFVGGGAVFTNPFGFNRDQIGVAIGWGNTDSENRDDENWKENTYLLETYWRFQLTERFEFTPNIQLHIQPAKERDRDVNPVGSLRAMWRF